ncbi:MAG TPA: VCBS repeat-containing protein, partial [Pyrinomonadaceae bacterium]
MISINWKFILVIFLSIIFFNTVKGQNADCKPFEFNLPQSFQTVTETGLMISADLNSDGNDDLFMPYNRTQSFSVMFGDGAGGFAPPRNFPAETGVSAITIGDLNRDGKLDLIGAVVGGNNGRIIVLLNNGQGEFSAPITTVFASGSYELPSLGIGDFNGDEIPDVAAVTGTNLHFLLGNGQGTLVLNTTLNWKGSRANLIVSNFNNDGLADVAVTTTEYPWEIGIVFGTRAGSFAVAKNLPLTGQATGLKIGDFNADGKQDLIVSAYYPYQNLTPQTYFLEPWLGDGAGNFNAGTKVQFPFQNDGVAVGDFNGDG